MPDLSAPAVSTLHSRIDDCGYPNRDSPPDSVIRTGFKRLALLLVFHPTKTNPICWKHALWIAAFFALSLINIGAAFSGPQYPQYFELNTDRPEPVSPDLPPDQQYAYAGAPVPFNPEGVYAVPTNPIAAGYPADSAKAFANDNFNYTYTSLLRAPAVLFNGQATQDQFNIAIGLMMSLKGQAKAMMSGIPNPAVPTGPSFQYQPENP
jgi:hypothetical protein